MSTLTKTTNSKTARSSSKEERPHRRLSLTRPTLPVTNDTEQATVTQPVLAGSTPGIESQPTISSVKKKRVADDKPVKSAVNGENENTAPVVRVMAYLSAQEATLLDDLWMEYRRSPQKPSKSDIMRAALILASTRADDLTATLSQQQTNTLSRQRVSKSKN